jgi:hypothetical protein
VLDEQHRYRDRRSRRAMTPILALVLLIIDIYVIWQVIQSSADSGRKLVWILVVLFLPLLGPVLWYLIEKKA